MLVKKAHQGHSQLGFMSVQTKGNLKPDGRHKKLLNLLLANKAL